MITLKIWEQKHIKMPRPLTLEYIFFKHFFLSFWFFLQCYITMVTCLARMERCDVMGAQTCWPEFWFPILLKPSRDKHQHRQTAGREADRQTSAAVWGGASQQSQSEAAVVGMRISQDKLENTSKIDKAALRWDGTGLFFLSLPPLPPPPLSLSLSRSLRWHPRSWQAACPAGRYAPRGHTSSPRQSGARLRSRPRPRRTPRHRRRRCSRKWLCTVSEDESFSETSDRTFAAFIVAYWHVSAVV